MADSGAYSAQSLGATIDINDYAQWIKTWLSLFDCYANLDVIGDSEGTLKNQQILEDMGLKPLPVFHVNEDWKYLEHYLDKYDYVALGGLVPYQKYIKRIMPWLIKAFRMLPKGKRYHGFGTTGWTVLKSFPWYSVDSSSWCSGYRFGSVLLFSAKEEKFVSADIGNVESCFKYRNLLEACGDSWQDFAYNSTKNSNRTLTSKELRLKVIAVSSVAMLRAEAWLEKRHSATTKIYQSRPSEESIKSMMEAGNKYG